MSRVRTVWIRFTVIAVSLAAAVVMFAADARAQANAEDIFRQGLQAYRQGQWQRAAVLMGEAIKLRPQESRDRIGGVFGGAFGSGDQYLPYFYLGDALFQAGDCVNARSAWAISRKQGAIAGEPLKRLEAGMAECERRLKFDQDRARIVQQYEEANGILTRIANLADGNLDVWVANLDMRAQYERAREELTAALERIKNAQPARASADLTQASAAVDRANTILVPLRTSLENAINSRRTTDSLLQEVRGYIAAAEKLDNTIAGKKVTFTPAMTTSQQQGRETVGRARRMVDGATAPSVPTLQSARTLALDAREGFEKLLAEIEGIERLGRQRELNDELSRATETLSFLDGDVATLQRRSAQRPGLLSEEEVGKVLQEVPRLRRRLDDARKSENVAVVAGVARRASEIREQINVWIAGFGPLTLRDRGVNAAIEEGARLFFDGQYQQVVSALEPGEAFGDDVPLRLHVHLFRAAAYYQLFVRSGETDQALRGQAAQEVEHCRQIDSAFQPDGRAFSPRFISFYQSVAAAGASTPSAPAAPTAQP